MMIKKLAPSPRDMVSSPRSHRSPTGGGDALSPRSEGGTTSAAATVRRATNNLGGGERPLSPEVSTYTHEKTKVLLSPRTSGGPITTANYDNVGESTNANIIAAATAPTILTEPPLPPPARSKRMLVVDPKSGRKYPLHEDDHSLTDKELHVYHRSNRSSTPLVGLGTLRHHPVGAAGGENPAAHAAASNNKPMHTKRPPTSNNIGSLFVNKTTASSPAATTKKNTATTTNTAAAVLSTRVNDDDARTYNSTALLMLNDDAHTLETASALTEVSYYYHTNNNCNRRNNDDGFCVGGRDGGMKKSSPFDCYLPTSCNSVGDLAGVACNDSSGNTLVGAAAATAAAGGGGGVQQLQGKKEGRDDVESMGRYRQYLLDEEQKKTTNTATLSPGNSSSIYTSNINKDGGNDYSHYQQQQQQQQQPDQSPITAAFSAIMDSPRLLFSGFFGNNQYNDNHLVTGGDTALQHPLAATATTSAPMVVRQELISFRRVVCMVVFPNEVRNTLDGKEVGLLGMKFEQSGLDFQAHVKWVQRGSKAEKMGVRRGDIVSVSCGCLTPFDFVHQVEN